MATAVGTAEQSLPGCYLGPGWSGHGGADRWSDSPEDQGAAADVAWNSTAILHNKSHFV